MFEKGNVPPRRVANAARRSAQRAHSPRHIQEWLGHRNTQHTTRYTELTTHRFKDFWQW